MRRDIQREFFDAARGKGNWTPSDAEYKAHTRIPQYEKILLPTLTPLRENFRTGKYGLVVGEDSSARLCTLVVGELAKKIADSAGVKAPQIRFVAGLTSLIPKEETRYMETTVALLKQWFGERQGLNILYSTESISTGVTLAHFLKAAHLIRAKVDVIVAEEFGTIHRRNLKKFVEELWLKETLGYFAVGPYVQDYIEEPVIFKDPNLTGIAGNSIRGNPNPSRPRPKGSKYENNPSVSDVYKYFKPKDVAVARGVVRLVAENLYAEIAPTLPELFEGVDISLEQYRCMPREGRTKYIKLLEILKIRTQNDPRVNQDAKSGETGFIEHDSFDTLIDSIDRCEEMQKVKLPDYTEVTPDEYYNHFLEALRNYLQKLEGRPYPKV